MFRLYFLWAAALRGKRTAKKNLQERNLCLSTAAVSPLCQGPKSWNDHQLVVLSLDEDDLRQRPSGVSATWPCEGRGATNYPDVIVETDFSRKYFLSLCVNIKVGVGRMKHLADNRSESRVVLLIQEIIWKRLEGWHKLWLWRPFSIKSMWCHVLAVSLEWRS